MPLTDQFFKFFSLNEKKSPMGLDRHEGLHFLHFWGTVPLNIVDNANLIMLFAIL